MTRSDSRDLCAGDGVAVDGAELGPEGGDGHEPVEEARRDGVALERGGGGLIIGKERELQVALNGNSDWV